MSLKGNLASVNLTEIFQMLSLSGREGTLFIYEGARKRAICFTKEGVSIRSRERNESNLIGKILVRLGRIDERELARAVETRRSVSKLLGDVLVEMNACAEDDVRVALRIQSEEEIQDLFLNRSDAQFEYVDGYFPETEIPYVNLNVNALLIEIARRTDEWEYIRRRIRGPREIYRFTGVEGAVDADVLQECYSQRIDPLIDGTHSIGELIDHSYVNKFEACKLLAAYLDAGVIEQVPPDAVRQNARLALRMGDTEGAIRHYEYLMTTGDFPLDVMAEAAEAHEANRDFPEAAALRRRLSEEMIRGGDYHGAMDTLRPVATYPRPEPEALDALMNLVFENPREAAEFAEDVVEAGKTLVAFYVNHEQKREALELLDRLLKTFPDEVAFAISLVNVHYEDGALDQAAAECERLAMGFLKRKRVAQAVSLFKKLLVIDPERQDIRERVRKIVSGKKRRKAGPSALPRLAIAVAISVLIGGAAVVVLKGDLTRPSGDSGLDSTTLENLFGRGVDEQTTAAEHGRRATREYGQLLKLLEGDPLTRSEELVSKLRTAEQQYQHFDERAQKTLSIAETILRQTSNSEAAARARAMIDGIDRQREDAQIARNRWNSEAQDTAERLRAAADKYWREGRHRIALERFTLARQLSTSPEWRSAKQIDRNIENIRRDVDKVERRRRMARGFEDDQDWTSARQIYLELLREYRDSDLVGDLRLPVEILSVPPGARILIDGAEVSQLTPAIIRLPHAQAAVIELRKETYETLSLTLGPFREGTEPARYQYTRDLRKTATWDRPIRGHIEADPAITRRRVAVVERNGRFYLFDARDGKQIASAKLDTFDGVTAGLSCSDDSFYFGSLDGKFFAFNAITGKREYLVKPSPDIESPAGIYAKAALADGVAYVVDYGGVVVARDLRTHKQLWRRDAATGVYRAAPVVQGEDLVVISVSGEVTVFKRETGDAVIQYRLRGTFLCGPALAGSDHLVFASEEGKLSGVTRLTGNVDWTRDVDTSLTRTPPVRGRAVFISPQPGQLIAIDRSTGDEIYRYVRSSAAARTAVMPNNRIFFVSGQTLSAFAPRADGYGLAWTFQARGRILAGPIVAEGAVYIADEKGYLYRLEAND